MRLRISLLACLLVLSFAANAGSMRCGRYIISEGASQYEVVTKCGEPAYQQWIEEPVTVVTTGQAQIRTSTDGNPVRQEDIAVQELAPLYRDIERWTYNQGSGKLLREVDFLNGEVIRIKTGGRAP